MHELIERKEGSFINIVYRKHNFRGFTLVGIPLYNPHLYPSLPCTEDKHSYSDRSLQDNQPVHEGGYRSALDG